jgi:hypothetical protein
MVINKNAQFFLLAAVIISVVVISLGITTNRATINREPGNFYDYSYEVKREAGAVLDYEIYTNVVGGPLGSFVELLSQDIRDKNPDADFLFLYGNNQSMELRNYGSEDAFADGVNIDGSGAGAISDICINNICQDIGGIVGDHEDDVGNATLTDIGTDLSVEVEGYNYSFPVSQHKQVIFIMQKDVGDESFITVK